MAALAVGLAVIGTVAWAGWRTWQAYQHLTTAQDIAATMQSAVARDGLQSLGTLQDHAGALAHETAAAAAAADDPAVWLTSHIPWIGNNMAAVRTVAHSLDGIAQATVNVVPALRPLMDSSDWSGDHHVNVDVVQPAAEGVIQVDAAIQSAIADLKTLPRASLVAPLNDALNTFGRHITSIAEVTHPSASAAAIVLPLLGADGPRTYLVTFQNLAEVRATGGLFGFYAELQVDDGSLTLGASGSASRDIGEFQPPVAGFPDYLDVLYAGQMTRYPQDVNLTPDFPTAASIFAEMYQQKFGVQVDGVIAMDPVVASVFMQGTDPIELDYGMELTADNAPDVLLSQMYETFPGGLQLAERDAETANALRRTFSAVIDNIPNLSPKELFDDVGDLIDERRLLVWSAHPDDQDVISTTAVSGRLLPDAPGKPSVGVFLNSRTGAKLDYYLEASAELAMTGCRPDGSTELEVTVTLVNHSPLTGLPPYVLGAMNGHEIPETYLNVVFASPTGGTMGDMFVDGVEVPSIRGVDFGRHVIVGSVTLPPEVPVTVTTTIQLPDVDGTGGEAEPRIVATPVVEGFDTVARSYTQCKRP